MSIFDTLESQVRSYCRGWPATFDRAAVLDPGTVNDFWYANHIEAVICVEGAGELLDKETGETYQITWGTMYLLDKHERHQLRSITPDAHHLRVQPSGHWPGGARRERGLRAVESTLDGATTSG